MPENRVLLSGFWSSYCTFSGHSQTVLMPLLEVLANLDSDVKIIIRIVILYSYKRSFTSHDV